ncbi:Crp/Fnr family transcriptional regulator [Brevundimonas sp. S30B]|uniref:Crp/Fnr family transcriptional regulator n=1 Tax=unclassified Brevundimonas TaxID=2622653 RepID=UPI001072312B|nr:MULTISPECIES: Crp/Fnr family transcriptional regulator [unclassified Brevundimonas]QBX38109.1 Crp/Fnr family transcriptional regulator [Brevundimonas sp. MF30-B]TFW02536.1 Crp/Fnr family transcriptional regulator [Brevundimonas sp. S30B]
MLDGLDPSPAARAGPAPWGVTDDMLDHHPVLRLLPAPLRDVVRSQGRTCACASGDRLSEVSPVVGFVFSGALAAFDDRGLACVDLMGPGATFGWETAFAPPPGGLRLALLDSRWIETPVIGLRDAMGAAWLEHVFARHAVDRIHRLKAESACHAVHAVPARAANLIRRLFQAGGPDVRTTQSAMAEAMGVQRTSVNAAVKALEKDRVVSLRRGRIKVLCAERLSRAACGC